MKNRKVMGHYRQYYRYDIPDGRQPDIVVNELYQRVMRNDREALDEVLKIFSSVIYPYVNKKLGDFAAEENVEDLIQNINVKVIECAFRGFPESLDADHFYIYLWGIAKNAIKKYWEEKEKAHKVHEAEELSISSKQQ